MKIKVSIHLSIFLMLLGIVTGQPAPSENRQMDQAEVLSEYAPPSVIESAVKAVFQLGDAVIQGKYHVALERMNPRWKEGYVKRSGGAEALERQLQSAAAQMVKNGVSMISFKPQGAPIAYGVAPGTRVVQENGVPLKKLVYTQWMVLVPTVTRYRVMDNRQAGVPPKLILLENTGYQVAVSDRDKNDWTFIDGSGLTVNDLRTLFITLPHDMKLPPVGTREAR